MNIALFQQLQKIAFMVFNTHQEKSHDDGLTLLNNLSSV